MPTDIIISNLVINKLTKAQYEAIETPNENELYLVPDDRITYRQSTGNTITIGEDEIVDCGTITNPTFTLTVSRNAVGRYNFFFVCGANSIQMSFGNINLMWQANSVALQSGVTYGCSILRLSNTYYGTIIAYENR